MLYPTYQEIIVWGLNNQRHSHRFIHQGFYENLSLTHENVYWLPNSKRINLSPFRRRLIIASGMASSNLPILPNTDYVLHNVVLTRNQLYACGILNPKILRLQVHTNDSKGEKFWDSPYVSLDVKNRTLYQPWGTPTPRESWNPLAVANSTSVEYWIGAVWNNKQNQGNSEMIQTYKRVLKSNSIDFKRIGGSRLRRDGITEKRAADLVRKSRIGAAIVGEWQQKSQYVPCRIFKNIAAGIAPVSNGDYRGLFGDSQIYSKDIEFLVHEAISESLTSKQLRLDAAQEAAKSHTYGASLDRIMESLDHL